MKKEDMYIMETEGFLDFKPYKLKKSLSSKIAHWFIGILLVFSFLWRISVELIADERNDKIYDEIINLNKWSIIISSIACLVFGLGYLANKLMSHQKNLEGCVLEKNALIFKVILFMAVGGMILITIYTCYLVYIFINVPDGFTSYRSEYIFQGRPIFVDFYIYDFVLSVMSIAMLFNISSIMTKIINLQAKLCCSFNDCNEKTIVDINGKKLDCCKIDNFNNGKTANICVPTYKN